MSWFWALITVAAVAASAVGGLASWLVASRARWLGYRRYKGAEQGRPPGLADLLGEGAAMLRLGWWHVRAWGRDGWIAPDEVRGPPVVCVHGFTQNGTNFWGIRRALLQRGRASRAVSLGLPGRSIERYAERLRAALAAAAETHGRYDVVAHSMGGLVLRRVLADDPALAAGLGHVVTLGTPHRGTAASRGVPGLLLPEIVQLKRRSTWLRDLPSLGQVAPGALRVTVSGDLDLVVYPPETCHEPDSLRVALDGVGHAALLASPDVVALVAAALDDELSPPEQGPAAEVAPAG